MTRSLSAAPAAICFGVMLAFAGAAHAQQQNVTGCAQKSDQEQMSGGLRMAQQASGDKTYAAQKTAGGGAPQSVIDQAQPHPTFPGSAGLASNNQSNSQRKMAGNTPAPCPPRG